MTDMIPVLGVDLSLSNLGLAHGLAPLGPNRRIEIDSIGLTETKKAKVKTLRRSADDFDRATQLKNALHEACEGKVMAMVEMPVGSQSARAMMSYGLAIGLIASLPIPIVQCTPREVKECSFGDKDAAKEDMINWACERYPDLAWIPGKSRGGLALKNEHMADAIACLHAGVRHDDFKRAVSMMKSLAA